MNNNNPERRDAAYALGALTALAVAVLLIAAVLTSPFSTTDKLLLLACTVGLCGVALAAIARSTP